MKYTMYDTICFLLNSFPYFTLPFITCFLWFITQRIVKKQKCTNFPFLKSLPFCKWEGGKDGMVSNMHTLQLYKCCVICTFHVAWSHFPLLFSMSCPSCTLFNELSWSLLTIFISQLLLLHFIWSWSGVTTTSICSISGSITKPVTFFNSLLLPHRTEYNPIIISTAPIALKRFQKSNH